MFYKLLTFHVGFFALVSCTGGSESGDDASVARGGNDDYGVEIPVATSLTLADFGMTSDNAPGKIQNIASSVSLSGSLDIATIEDNGSGSEDVVLAVLSPAADETCVDFAATLNGSGKTEEYLKERRTYIPRSALKTNADGTVSVRVDASQDRLACSAVLPADTLPSDKGYQGDGGSIAFLLEGRPTDGYTESVLVMNLWTDQAGQFTGKEVTRCSDSEYGCNPLGYSKDHALSYLWDSDAGSYRFLMGKSDAKRVYESTHLNWIDGEPLNVSSLGTVPSGTHIGGLAIRNTGSGIERRAFMQNLNTVPILYEHLGGESWTDTSITNNLFGYDSDAWMPRVLSDGTAAYIDDLGNTGNGRSYRTRMVNLFTAEEAGNLNSKLEGNFTCQNSTSIEEQMAVAPTSGGYGYYLLTCNNVVKFMQLNAEGSTMHDIVLASNSIISRKRPAISVHSDRLPEVFFAGVQVTQGPSIDPVKIFKVGFQSDRTPNEPVEMSLESNDGSSLENQTVTGIQAIQDYAGRSYLVFVTSDHQAAEEYVYLATPFPNNKLNYVRIHQGSGTGLSNMILYGRD